MILITAPVQFSKRNLPHRLTRRAAVTFFSHLPFPFISGLCLFDRLGPGNLRGLMPVIGKHILLIDSVILELFLELLMNSEFNYGEMLKD